MSVDGNDNSRRRERRAFSYRRDQREESLFPRRVAAAAFLLTVLAAAGSSADSATATKTGGPDQLTPYQQIVKLEVLPEDLDGGGFKCAPVPLPPDVIVTAEQMSAVAATSATLVLAEIQIDITGGDSEHHVFDLNQAGRWVRIGGPVHLGLDGSAARACIRGASQARVTFRLSGYERS